MDPENDDAAAKHGRRPQPPPDRPAFLAVLATGIVIDVAGHLGTADVIAEFAALAALYSAYRQS